MTKDSGPFSVAGGAKPTLTSATGLDAGMVALPGGAPAYFAKPENANDLPIVLVAQEIFGLNEHICDVVRRLARLNYFAVAPDYLLRYGDPTTAPDIDAIRAIVARVPDAETVIVFDEALAYAGKRGGDMSRAAITGFCWGGRIAWLYAAHNPGLRACVPWYGRLDGARTSEQPRWPIDVAGELKVPTLALYGGADPSIPNDLVEKMRARLSNAGADADIILYDNCPHAFFADYRESYRETAAKDAWGRMRAFLRAQGVG